MKPARNKGHDRKKPAKISQAIITYFENPS